MENYSEILTDYLNGTLSPAAEEELFSALSADPVLRDEFNRYISINSSLKASSDSYVPPASVTNNIFSEVGFTPLSPEKITPKPGKYAFFKSKLFTGIGSGLFAVAVTLWLTGSFSADNKKHEAESFNEPKKQEIALTLPDINDNTKSLANAEDIPVTKSSENILGDFSDSYKNKQNIVQNNNTSIKEQEQKDTEISNFHINPISKALPEKSNYNNFDYTQGKPTQMQPGDVSAIIYSNLSNLNLRLELTGSYTRNIPETTIGPANISDLNNLNFSAFYALDGNFDIGAGIRQETFFTNYTGTEEEFLYEYEQQPNFTTYEVKARFYPLRNNYFKPFIETTAGVNGEGFLWRASMGSKMKIYKGFGTLLGISYDKFYFNHQSKWFDTEKASLYFGLSYGF